VFCPVVFFDIDVTFLLFVYTWTKLHLYRRLNYSIIFDNQKGKEFERNISYHMFWEVAKDQYGAMMENIKDDWKRNRYSADGKYIAPMPETFTKKYIKQILNTIQI